VVFAVLLQKCLFGQREGFVNVHNPQMLIGIFLVLHELEIADYRRGRISLFGSTVGATSL
jgi:hypothetical protein